MKINFVINEYRKGSVVNNFDSKLSKYWQDQYYSLFRKWY